MILVGTSSVALAASQEGQMTAQADEVVVTGERRPVSIDLASSSVSVISVEELRRIGADHPSEVLNRVPGVLLHRGSGQEHLTSIRSPVLTGGAGAGSFLYLQNGVPLRAAGFANVNGLLEAHDEIADAIEVVRGPSGALYGSNAIHGVIDIRTPRAADSGWGGVFSVDTIGRIKTTGEATWVGESQGLYLGLSVLDDPGFRADSGADQQKITLRHDTEAGRLSVSSVFSAVNINQETAGFVTGEGAYLDATRRRTNPNPEAFRDVKALRFSSRIDWKADDELTFSITPYARWTDMDFLLHFLPSDALEENSHWSLGAQSAVYWDRSNLSVIAGVDFETTQGDLREFQSRPTIFSFNQGLHYDYSVHALSASPFVNITWRPTPRLTITPALRVDWTRYDYDNQTGDGIFTNDAGQSGRFLRPADRVDEYTTVSPKLTAAYGFDDLTAYASYARGARPPQTTDLYRLQRNQTSAPAKAETIDAVEIGLRGTVRDNIRYHFTGYFMEKDNFFFRDADGFNVSNGRTRHLGAEGIVSANIFAGLSIEANAAFGRHTYRFERPVNSGANALEAISFGDFVDSAPKWLAGGRIFWQPESSPIKGELEWVHVSQYFMDASNSVVYPGHDVLNLRGAWQISGDVEFFTTLRNITNTFYAERADFAFRTQRFFPGEGRVLTIGFRVGGSDR